MNARDWRIGSLLSESWRSATAQKGRLAAVVGAALFAIAGLATTELQFSSSLVDYQATFLHRGGSVAVIRDVGGINGQRCAALASRPEILRSGGFRTEAQPVRVTNAPGDQFLSIYATHQIIELWTDHAVPLPAVPGAIFLGSDAAAEIGVETGMLVQADETEPVRVAGILEMSARNPRAGRSLIQLNSPVSTVDECWVEFKPNMTDVGTEVLKLQFAHPERGVEVRPWIKVDEFSRDIRTEFQTRLQRFWWLPVGVILSLLLWLTAWFRRSELAVYRAVGTPPATLYLMGQIEALLLLVVPSVAGFLLAVTIQSGIAGELPTMERILSAARTSFSATTLAVILSPIAWLSLGRGDIAPKLKDF